MCSIVVLVGQRQVTSTYDKNPHWARSKHLLNHWYDGDNDDVDCDDDYITCMAVINLQHQTGPEA